MFLKNAIVNCEEDSVKVVVFEVWLKVESFMNEFGMWEMCCCWFDGEVREVDGRDVLYSHLVFMKIRIPPSSFSGLVTIRALGASTKP